MSKLDELIIELCPDGVEYKKIHDISRVLRGRRLTKRELSDQGRYPVFHGGLEPLGFYFESNRKANSTMIINVGASAGTVGYCDVDFWSSDGCYCIEGNDSLSQRYIYHTLKKYQDCFVSKVRYAGIPTLDAKIIENFEIPFPPLPVQHEIVRILDSFTELTSELTAELGARKKQYSYYLDKLYGNDYESMLEMADGLSTAVIPLSEVGTLIRGKRFVKADSEGLTSGVPCLHYGELYTCYGISARKSKSFVNSDLASNLRFAQKGDVVIVGAGENNIDIGVGVAWFGDEDIAVHDACYILKHNQNPKYISYYLRTNLYHNQIKKYVSEGKICSIQSSGLGKVLIPVPSLMKQDEIVSTLESFNALCNDITTGLPAEIEARKKQYEYYRDKLLTFPEAKV